MQKQAEYAEECLEYGIDCSLNILATEEAIKACFCFMKDSIKDKELQDFEGMFKSHAIKHHYIQFFTEVFRLMINFSEKIAKASYDSLEIYKWISDEAYEFAISMFPQNLNENKIDDVKEAIKWWKKANLMKNNGFYVGYDNNSSWNCPQNTSLEEFNKSKKYSKFFIDFVDYDVSNP